MATFPRVGVLQAPLADVYGMQHDIEANDPLRQALGLAGDVAGRYNRRAEYAQASGAPNPPQTIGQMAGGVAKRAWSALTGGSSEEDNARAKEPQSVLLPAPDWSEMARIDPERARFDRSMFESGENRKARGEEIQARERMASAELKSEADIEAQKLAAKEQSASSLDELQQLWKDNTRGLTEAKRSQDSAAVAMYQGNLDRLQPLLQSKAPEVWGPPGAVSQPDASSEDFRARKNAARSEGFAEISQYATDKDKNGVVDSPKGWVQAFSTIRDKYGVSDADMADVTRAWEAAVKNLEDAHRARMDREEVQYSRGRQKSQDELALADKRAAVGALLLAYNNLQTNPSDKTYKSSALTSILRRESGAAIGASEFMGRMKEWLPPEKYQKLQDEMSGVGMLVAGKLAPNAADIWQSKIADRYLDDVDTRKLLSFMDAMIPSYAKPKDGKKEKQSATEETAVQRLRRLRAARGVK